MFRSVTDTLWHTVESSYAYMADDIVWDRFTVAVKKKFIPDHIGVQKLAEFEQLTQGSMTVRLSSTNYLDSLHS